MSSNWRSSMLRGICLFIARPEMLQRCRDAAAAATAIVHINDNSICGKSSSFIWKIWDVKFKTNSKCMSSVFYCITVTFNPGVAILCSSPICLLHNCAWNVCHQRWLECCSVIFISDFPVKSRCCMALTGIDDHETSSTTSLSPSVSAFVSSLLPLQSDEFSKSESDFRSLSGLLWPAIYYMAGHNVTMRQRGLAA